MGKITYNKEYGWYGNCSSPECKDLYLSTLDVRNNIDSIVRTKSVGDATGYEKFTCYDGTQNFTWASRIGRNQTVDDYFNFHFDKLECGRGYLVNVNTRRNLQASFDIPGLNMPNGTSFVSNNCSDVIKVPCTEDDHVTIDVSVGEYKIQHNISIQMTSSYFGGTFSLPPRDTNSGYLPKSITVYMENADSEAYFAKVIYNGGPLGSNKMYFKADAGDCYSGTINLLEGTCTLSKETIG